MGKRIIGLASFFLVMILIAGCGTVKRYHVGYTGPVLEDYEEETETYTEPATTAPEEVIPTYTLMTVTTDTLNVRSGPGKKNEAVGELHWGDLVALYEVEGSWGRIESGWVSLDYIEEHNPIISEDNDKRADGMPYKLMKVTAKSLYIRSGAAKKYDSIGEFHQGDMVAVYETYKNWGRTDLGWINLEYAEDHNPGIQLDPPLDIERPDDYIHPTIVGEWYRFSVSENLLSEYEYEYVISTIYYGTEGGTLPRCFLYFAGGGVDSAVEAAGELSATYTFDGVRVVETTDMSQVGEDEVFVDSYRIFVIDDILIHEDATEDEYNIKVYYVKGDLEDAVEAIDRYHAKKYPPETPDEPGTDATAAPTEAA